jgi:hypothetical protein
MRNRGCFCLRQWKTVLIYAVLSLMLCFTGRMFASVTYDDIVVSVDSPSSGRSQHGYVEYSVSVTNTSKDRTHSVVIATPRHGYGGYGDYISELTRSVIVPPATSVSVLLLQPPVPIHGSDIEVTIDGRLQRETVQFSAQSHCQGYPSYYYSGHGATQPVCVLLSRNVSFDDFDKGIEEAYATGTPAGRSTSYHGDSPCSFVRAEKPVSAWSTNWLAYTCYDGIVVKADDMRDIQAQVSSALLQYLQCGGSLLVLGPWEPPGDWSAGKGQGGYFDLFYVGFGVCAVSQSRDSTGWSVDKFKYLKEQVWSPSGTALTQKKNVSESNAWFPVIANLAMPVRGLFLLVLFFAIIIGPANLLVLSSRRRRIWMLWTVPFLSIIASLSVIFYALVAEGWRGHVRTQAITILDEASRRASTIAISAYYCPLMPRGGLHFDYETELTPIAATEYREGNAKTIDWTSDQHLASGWIAARVPVHLLVRKNQLRRERVKITSDKGKIEALNGLGEDINQLWYCDGQGRIYGAEKIPAGAKTGLEPKGMSISSPETDALRRVFSSSWLIGSDDIARQPMRYLRFNSYIAVLDGAPFVEQPLKNPKTRNLKSVVIGILNESADADKGG